ncbi:MAG: 50S ribosomal protein L17 [Elusimicrobiaceae bacterium]|jgi:large subunit ribosomal protein L17|nr:50S ribosomal protein L17 [Elusimicrobiaceae bacterium]MBT3955257.1 50S ribosomal protein L17 [Elusimicrobiaceae bacterium]MBT4007771.1 50S ribosomal protein L17 [Elusimicrobiaceae bacterium]MBT4402417.1 50S ribosomal protein L17 [Elusimicrobiaceae bacterium]MBT4440412.1 50S ribosomal protein L17 [Elusimicrobiaceae bacterium]
MIKNLGYRKLSKTSSHRKAMLTNMATSIILHEQIETTVPKAKEVRRVVEKVITEAKKGQHLKVRNTIKDKVAFNKLFEVLAKRYETRPGGYTKIMKSGIRRGDNVETALVKLVD